VVVVAGPTTTEVATSI